MKKNSLNRALAAKKTKVSIILVCLTMMANSLYATVYNGSLGPELTYTLDSGTGHVVIEGRGAMTSDDLSNYPKREYVKTVSFPEGLTSICANAFHGCYNLQSVVLPDSVTSIGAYAFQECTALKSCDLGKGIKTIGSQAFSRCTALQKVRWSDCLESIGMWAFYNCTSLGDTVFFPKTLKTIGSEAFHSENYNSSSKVMVWEVIHMNDFIKYESDVPGECHFEYIIFGDSVEYIPARLCHYMYNDSICLPQTVKAIGERAFASCSRLQKVNIPEGVTSIGTGAFAGSKNLKQLVLPDGLKEIPEQLCYNCSALDSVRLPEGIKVIPQKAFQNCTALHSIHLPNSITNIGNSAFAHCMLDTLVLPTSLTVLGDGVFNKLEDHASPKHLVLNDKLIATGMHTFANWTELQTITIGRNVAILGQNCFWYDSLVTDITCYATQPPLIYDATFEKVPDSARLHVPAASVNAYKSAQYWSRFRIVAMIDTASVQPAVAVDATGTTANFTWPAVEGTTYYTLVLWADEERTEKMCTLTFNAAGQLVEINFSNHAPARQAQYATDSFSFRYSGLAEGTEYWFTMTATDEDENELYSSSGSFRTKGENGTTTGIDEVQSDKVQCTKVLRDGKLYIMHGGTMYDIQGNQIK